MGNRGEGKSQFINQILIKPWAKKYGADFAKIGEEESKGVFKFVERKNFWNFPIPSQPASSYSETILVCQVEYQEEYFSLECSLKLTQKEKKKIEFQLTQFTNDVGSWEIKYEKKKNEKNNSKIQDQNSSSKFKLKIFQSKKVKGMDQFELRKNLIEISKIISFLNKNWESVISKLNNIDEKVGKIQAIKKLILRGPFESLLLKHKGIDIPIHLQDVPGLGSLNKYEIENVEYAAKKCDIAFLFCGKRGIDTTDLTNLLKACKNREKVGLGRNNLFHFYNF